jgi:hypothetical protein
MWLNSTDDFPTPDGGGCESIEFDYDQATGQLSPLQCNGPY